MKRVTIFMEWLKQNPKASEKDVNASHDKLLSEAQTTLSGEIKAEITMRSKHVFEMSKMTAKYCMNEGMTQVMAKSKEGLESAVGWFRKAYHIASGKGQMNKMVAASQKMAHAMNWEQFLKRLLTHVYDLP